MLSVNHICKNYGKKNILKDVTFEINRGEIVGVLGPNGVGKTTLIKLLCGINRQDNGEIRKDHCKIAVVFDFNGLYTNFNAIENLKLFLGDDNDDIIEEYLKKFNLWERRKEKVSKYSKGMLRKLAVVRALITNPDLLILDEPFDGIDVENKKIWIDLLGEWVKEKNCSVIISSHILSEVEQICSRILILSKGRLIWNLYREEWNDMSKGNLRYVIRPVTSSVTFERLKNCLNSYHCKVERKDSDLVIEIYDEEKFDLADEIDQIITSNRFKIVEKYYIKRNLEELYLKIIENDLIDERQKE